MTSIFVKIFQLFFLLPLGLHMTPLLFDFQLFLAPFFMFSDLPTVCGRIRETTLYPPITNQHPQKAGHAILYFIANVFVAYVGIRQGASNQKLVGPDR